MKEIERVVGAEREDGSPPWRRNEGIEMFFWSGERKGLAVMAKETEESRALLERRGERPGFMSLPSA